MAKESVSHSSSRFHRGNTMTKKPVLLVFDDICHAIKAIAFSVGQVSGYPMCALRARIS